MALVRASRKQIASRSIRGRHEWLEECIPCQCHPGRLGHAVLKTLYPAISPFEISNFAGYDLEHLAEDSLVVDVGGGVGAQSLTLAQHHPQLRFVIQDRESVLGDAIDVCTMNRIRPPKYATRLQDALATVLEEEHARCTRIRSGENPGPELL